MAFFYYSSYHCHNAPDYVVGKDFVDIVVVYVDDTGAGIVAAEGIGEGIVAAEGNVAVEGNVAAEGNLVLADTAVVGTVVEVDSLV